MNFTLLSLLSLILITSCGDAKKNKKQSESVIQDITRGGGYLFSDLPLEGKVADGKNLWSGDHWPMNKSSINYRWQTLEKDFNKYENPSQEELELMTHEEVATLSPSEKIGIMSGDYNYSFFKEVGSKVNIVALAWEGIGDGWSAATIFHDEPRPVSLTNSENITVNFGSSDIKALLSYYYSQFHNAAAEQMGLRCNTPQNEASEDIKCNDDLTPAQFHHALGKVIGQMQQSVIMDLDRFEQVWNHPITSYQSTIISEGDPSEQAPAGATKTLGIKTKVTYLDRAYNHAWGPVKGTWNQVQTNRVYTYQIHLNAKGEVIGSNWLSHDRPDFLWIPRRVERFEGKMALIQTLLDASNAQSAPAPAPEE